MAKLTSPPPDSLDVDKAQVDEFLKARRAHKDDAQSATSEIGSLHKQFVEKTGLNKKGLVMFTTLPR